MPDLVLEISATPKTVMMGGDYHRTDVEFSEAIESELIKKEVLLNNEIVKNIDDSRNAVEAVINAALEKRDELAEIYAENGLGINPLLLIQLPNDKETMSDLDIKDKEMIENILLEKGYCTRRGLMKGALGSARASRERRAMLVRMKMWRVVVTLDLRLAKRKKNHR